MSDPDSVYRTYLAQCLKDDTMAECIVDYMQTAKGELRKPLIVHLNGKFHSDHGLGVAARVRQRSADSVVVVLSTLQDKEMQESFLRSVDAPAEYVLLVPDVPPAPRRAAPRATPRPVAQKEPAEAPAKAAAEPAPEPKTSEPSVTPALPLLPPPDPNARPALGFRPDYEFEGEGVRVSGLLEGGPAEKAGIHEGDVLLGVAGFHIVDLPQYTEMLGMLRVGEEVEVIVRRGGMIRKMPVRVGSRD